MNRVEELVEQFMETHDPGLLDEAIEVGHTAVADHDLCYGLGTALLLRFHARQTADDLEEAVRVLTSGSFLGTAAQRLRTLSMLAHTRLELYNVHREAAQLRWCIVELRQLTMMNHLSAADAADYGQALVRINELEEDPMLVEEAIAGLRATLATEPGGVAENDCRMWLSTAHIARFGMTGEVDDVHEGLRWIREDPAADYREPDPGGTLFDFGRLVLMQPAGPDLDRAAILLRAAARFSPDALNLLAKTLMQRYVNDGHIEQISQARRALGAWDGFPEDELDPILGAAFRGLDRPGIEPADYEQIFRLLRFLDAVMPAPWRKRELVAIVFADAAKDYYRLTYEPGILDEAIDMLRRRPAVDDPLAVGDATLGTLIGLRHHHPGHEQDLDEAVSVLRAAPDTHVVRAALGPMLLQRWILHHDRRDLDASLEIMRQVVSETPVDDHNWPARTANLAEVLRAKYRVDRDQHDLGEAIALLRSALERTSPDSIGYATRAAGLGATLSLDEDQASLAEGVELLRAAAARPWGPQQPRMLSDLAHALLKLGTRTRNAALLDEARSIFAECADAPDIRTDALIAIARTLSERYEILGEAADLDATVRAARDASAETPDALTYLGQALRVRADVTGNLEDADEAVRVLRQAGEDTPSRKIALGLALCSRFEAGGAREDVDDAAAYIEQALDAMDAQDSDRPGAESDLGLVLARRFGTFGAPADLDRAIDLHRHAVSEAEPGHPDRARRLLNLSGPLRQRYERFGALADLNESLGSLRQVVFDLPYRAGERPELMADLAIGLAERSRRTGEHADLVEGADVLRQALDLMPPVAAARPKALSALAMICLYAARQGAVLDGLGESAAALLDSAVELERSAIETAEPGHYNTRFWQANLAAALFTRHQTTGDRRDTVEAVSLLRTVLNTSGEATPDRGGWQANLAFGLTSLAPTTEAEYAEELAAYRAAAEADSAPADIRLDAARWWGATAANRADWPEAVVGYTRAIGLLPLAVFRGLHRSDQESKLSGLAGLASDAAACAIRAADPDLALELLEQGRGILLAQAFETRDDFDDLELRHPARARAFRELRARLDTPAQTDGDLIYRLAQQCTDLIEEIRALPRFERFLLPPPSSDLQETVPKGAAAVVVNVSRFGCDALIVARSRIEALALPGLNADELLGQSRRLLAATLLAQDSQAPYETQVGAMDEFKSGLDWLAETIVAPILRHLDIPHGTTARLWWIPTGVSAFLPLHAAGEAPDRLVSSYIPSLSSLARARRNPPEPHNHKGIIVTATDVPGHARLIEGDREAAQVAALLPEAKLLHDATPAQVLEALGDPSFAHFVCHAQSDMQAPSNSRLILSGGELTVRQIAERRSPIAFLAYLSACSTSRTNVALADESIHISSAFQLAGYRHVIATLWPIADGTAYDVAREVYQKLLPDPATALHQAVRDLRDRDPGDVVNWSAIIHTGP